MRIQPTPVSRKGGKLGRAGSFGTAAAVSLGAAEWEARGRKPSQGFASPHSLLAGLQLASPSGQCLQATPSP